MFYSGECLQGTERVKPEVEAVEVKVDTVDHRSPVGNDQAPKQENVQVIHKSHEDVVDGGGSVLICNCICCTSTHSSISKICYFW